MIGIQLFLFVCKDTSSSLLSLEAWSSLPYLGVKFDLLKALDGDLSQT